MASPLALHCQELALRAAYRLHVSQGWKDGGDVRVHRDFHLHDLKTILPPPATAHPPLSLESTGSRDNPTPSPLPLRSTLMDPRTATGPGTVGALPLMMMFSTSKVSPLTPILMFSLQS